MTKHTPGKWSVEETDDSFFVCPESGEYAAVLDKRWACEDLSAEEIVANARLIAAAPEMLELLQYFLKYRINLDTRVRTATTTEMIERVIAKATGEK